VNAAAAAVTMRRMNIGCVLLETAGQHARPFSARG
jgi:hypothetical protein